MVLIKACRRLLFVKRYFCIFVQILSLIRKNIIHQIGKTTNFDNSLMNKNFKSSPEMGGQFASELGGQFNRFMKNDFKFHGLKVRDNSQNTIVLIINRVVSSKTLSNYIN
jgi:hypothetical protein